MLLNPTAAGRVTVTPLPTYVQLLATTVDRVLVTAHQMVISPYSTQFAGLYSLPSWALIPLDYTSSWRPQYDSLVGRLLAQDASETALPHGRRSSRQASGGNGYSSSSSSSLCYSSEAGSSSGAGASRP